MTYPVLIFGKNEIANTFRVSRKTVSEWYKQGAPIAFDGQKYSCELSALQAWRVQHEKKQ